LKGIKKGILALLIILIAMSLSSCLIGTEESDKKMLIGIKNGNLEQVKEALEDGANIDKIEGLYLEESNPFWLALLNNRDHIAEYLIEHGADANSTDIHGVPLLTISAYNGNIYFSELLLEHGADINAIDKKGYTALEAALIGRKSEKETNSLITLLLDNGAKITPTTLEAALKGNNDNGDCRYGIVRRILEDLIEAGYESGLDPLLEAAILGDSSKVDELIKADKMREEDKQLIMFYTVAFGNVETLKLLENKGVDLQSSDKFYNEPLTIAAKYGQLEMVEYLLSKNVDIEAQNGDDETALMEAVINDQYEVAEYLLKKGAKTHYTILDKYPRDALYKASRNGNIEMMKLIINNGYTLNDKSIDLAMHGATEKNQTEALKYLLSIGADIGIEYDSTPLLETACLLGNLEVVKLLVENGTNIDGKNGEGRPLNLAAYYGNTEIVEYLIENGVNVNAVAVSTDDEKAGLTGSSALMRATYKGNLDIIKLLVENGADLEYQYEQVDNDTVLITAAERGSRNIVEYFIQKGSDINYQNQKGKTALIKAVEKNNADNVKVLLKYGADISLKDENGLTALDIAKAENKTKIIEIIEKAK